MSYGMNKKIQRVKTKTPAALGYGGRILDLAGGGAVKLDYWGMKVYLGHTPPIPPGLEYFYEDFESDTDPDEPDTPSPTPEPDNPDDRN